MTLNPHHGIAFTWWISRADGEVIMGEHEFMHGGVGREPDWLVAREADHDEPTEYIAERFTRLGAGGLPTVGGGWHREEVRRVFSVTDEW